MKINWKVRFKNKSFWLYMIPAVILLIQQICAVFGVTLAVDGLENNLISIVGTVFGILAVLGVVVDPTTAGASDSAQAMSYTKPKGDDVR